VQTITSSGLRRKLREVLAQLKRSTEPYFIMQYSRPVAVLVDVDDFENLRKQSANPHPRIARHPEISGGEPILAGTRLPVREIVQRVHAGQSAEDIAAALPPLTPGRVYDALSYYFDNQDEVELLIAESDPKRVLESAGLEAHQVAPGIIQARRRCGPLK
jgi:prevent-host-death family protein